MRGLFGACVAFHVAFPVTILAASTEAAPAWADQGADLRLVGSTVAHPAGKYWLDQNLALSVSDPVLDWPRLHAELTADTDRVSVVAAFAEIGSRDLSLRLGLFRLPLGRSNAVGVGDAALASRPLIFEEASLIPIAGAGALASLTLGTLSLSGGIAHGGNAFFGGGQVGVLRWVWLSGLPGGITFEAGASAATNQAAMLGGADVSVAWRGAGDFGVLLGGEGLAGWGGWNPRAGFGAGGYGLAALGWGPHELAMRYDMAGVTAGLEAERAGFALAYGIRVSPRAVLRFEVGRHTDGTPYVPEVPVDRVLLQLVWALGKAGLDRPAGAASPARVTALP